MAKIEPIGCPFCGSVEVEICRTNPNACWVRCAQCGADSQSHRTRAKAISNWNRRSCHHGHMPARIVDDDDKDRWTAAQKRAAR